MAVAIHPINKSRKLLFFIFTFAHLFEHGEACFLGVGNGQWLEFVRRAERRNDFAHRLFAGRTFFQRRRGQRPVQREFAAANHAIAFAQFILIKRHEINFNFQPPLVESNFSSRRFAEVRPEATFQVCFHPGKSASFQQAMRKIFSILLLISAISLYAADKTNSDSKTNLVTIEPLSERKNEAAIIPDASHKPVLTTNSVMIGGQRVTYVAETGMLPILTSTGTVRAAIFYVAYTRAGETDKSPRPVTFCFNGGPGSSSVWLHLGALGPRRVKMNENGTLPAPPFSLMDNEYSILDNSDLVFIDPIATGFSRAANAEKPEQFFGNDADLNSVGEFIRLWTTRHDRWLSPKYLCGESYGVFRAAGLADYLNSRYGMSLNGLILVSGVLDFSTIITSPGNDVPYPLILPAYTAAAYFHKKLPPDLQNDLSKALAESRTFAKGDYVKALQQGDSLPAEDRKKIVAELSRLTGLAPQVVEDNNLRVDGGVFRKQLLHDQNLILGAYDARITGRDDDAASPYPDFDPSMAAVHGPFAAGINSYIRGELKFQDDLPYELLAGVQPWKYGAENNFANAGDRLAHVMNQNPYMKILVLGGRCDLVCPIDTVHYALDHIQLAPEYRTNITYAQFDAGHMMYVNLPDLKKMHGVIEEFLKP